jgi:hypothetical protein
MDELKSVVKRKAIVIDDDSLPHLASDGTDFDFSFAEIALSSQ